MRPLELLLELGVGFLQSLAACREGIDPLLHFADPLGLLLSFRAGVGGFAFAITSFGFLGFLVLLLLITSVVAASGFLLGLLVALYFVAVTFVRRRNFGLRFSRGLLLSRFLCLATGRCAAFQTLHGHRQELRVRY